MNDLTSVSYKLKSKEPGREGMAEIFRPSRFPYWRIHQSYSAMDNHKAELSGKYLLPHHSLQGDVRMFWANKILPDVVEAAME
jgi:hypothetical protein